MLVKECKRLIGKVVTIRSITGEEYIAKLKTIDDIHNTLTVLNPRVVMINDDQVVLLPFVLTAKAETVMLPMDNVFSVLHTLSETAKDYEKLVALDYAEDQSLKEDDEK